MNFPNVNRRAWAEKVEETKEEFVAFVLPVSKFVFFLAVLAIGYYLGSTYNFVYRDFEVVAGGCEGQRILATKYQDRVLGLWKIKFICLLEGRN